MDLVVRLLGDASSTIGAATASKSAWKSVDNQINSLIETMRRQQAETTNSARVTKVLELADKGASAAKVDLALQLANEADAQDLLNAENAEGAAIEAKRQASIAALISTLEKQANETGHVADLTAVYQLEMLEASDAEMQWANSLLATIALTQQKGLAEKQSTADSNANAAAIRSQELAGKTLIQSLNQQRLALTQGALAARLHAIENSNLSLTDKSLAFSLERGNELLRQRQQMSMRAAAAATGHSAAANKTALVLQALSFGVQDAAQVYGNTGLAGAISASANNLIFMTSLMNPHLAIVTALVVAGGQFLAVLWPTITGTKNQKEALEELLKTQQKQLEQQEKINSLIREGNRAREAVTDGQSANSLVKNKEASLRDIKEETDQIQALIAQQLRAREQRLAIRNEERSRLTLMGQGTTAVGITAETVSQKELDAFNKRIIEQQGKLNELAAKEKVIQEQLAAARKVANSTNEIERRAAATRHAAAQEEADWKTRQAIAKQTADRDAADLKQRVAARRDAEKEIASFQKQMQETRIDNLDEDNQKRQKLADELNERLRHVKEWKDAQILSYQEAAQARMDAERAFRTQAIALEGQFEERKAKEAEKAMKEEKAKKKKIDSETKDVSALTTDSAAGFKAVFNATNGGQGPMEGLLKVGENHYKEFMRYVRVFDDFTEMERKKGVTKVK